VEIESAPARLRTLTSWLLNQAALAAQRRVADALSAVGAHRSHYAVLAALAEFGPHSQAALGRRCGIDRSDMVALVNELAAEGLVDRQPDDRDRRRNVVTITTAGRRRLRTLEAAVGRAQDELVSALSAKERAQLVALLTRVVEDQSPT
jgi:MarR family transcriptional regulator, lower aerobic nicotinate degradation pathway regulator